ncbi:MAG TPA: CpaD family pilus assembly protein [Hyphomicrobiaceae bacterium]|nr:CpaD family pilus assembly protein [Hyphomicrobiaceae bacterium]
MKVAQRRLPAAPGLSARKLALAAACGLLVSACDDGSQLGHHRLDNASAVGLSNPELRHPIAFKRRAESLDVEVPAGAEGLSANQHVDVYRFLQRYKHEAVGRLAISVPSEARDRAAIARSVQGIQAHVAAAGVDYRMLRGSQGPRLGDVPSIRLAYQRPVAVPPDCDRWPEDVGRNEERIPYPNWGCATQRNLAVMVDNARDLRQPQAEDPRSSERRSATWSAYVGSAPKPAADAGDDKKTSPTAPKK